MTIISSDRGARVPKGSQLEIGDLKSNMLEESQKSTIDIAHPIFSPRRRVHQTSSWATTSLFLVFLNEANFSLHHSCVMHLVLKLKFDDQV